MDLAHTIEPNSEQVNADDLVAAPQTVTITNVEAGTTEQPVFIHLAEIPGRTYRPGKSMRRVLVAAWGPEASAYIGRRLTLYNDPTIRFGRDVTGGVRISHMSHIDKVLTVALTVTRGSRKPFTVQPLPDAAEAVTAALKVIAEAESLPALKAAWDLAGKRGVQGNPDVLAAKDKRKAELTKEES